MNTVFIVLQQTQTGAVVEIILLLLVAGTIAYLTSYLYYRSVYTAKIRLLEEEISRLAEKAESLEQQKVRLEQLLSEKEKEIVSVKKPAGS